MVDSDGTCAQCKAGLEQFCPNMILTFNSPDKHLGGVTYGGYSESIVVDEHFVLRLPSNLNLPRQRRCFCAGITTYSPMHHWGVTKGKKVGVVGLGGLGHMAVKLRMRSGRTSLSSPLHPERRKTRSGSAPTKSLVSRNANEMKKHETQLRFHPRRCLCRSRYQRLYQFTWRRRQSYVGRRSGEACRGFGV